MILTALAFNSCGTYQSSSYYDRDGVYGDNNVRSNYNQNNSNEYQNYFSSLKEDPVYDTFTDVDNYSSQNMNQNVQENQNGSNYGSWGSNGNGGVVVNVYDNGWNNGFNNWGLNGFYGNYWGYNNWGWNGFYGNNWGWGLGFNTWYNPGWFGYYGFNNGFNNYGYAGYGGVITTIILTVEEEGHQNTTIIA